MTQSRSEYWAREAVAESGWWNTDTNELDLDALRSSIASAISAAIEEDRRLRSGMETPTADPSQPFDPYGYRDPHLADYFDREGA
jgi:hypothetical protein